MRICDATWEVPLTVAATTGMNACAPSGATKGADAAGKGTKRGRGGSAGDHGDLAVAMAIVRQAPGRQRLDLQMHMHPGPLGQGWIHPAQAMAGMQTVAAPSEGILFTTLNG